MKNAKGTPTVTPYYQPAQGQPAGHGILLKVINSTIPEDLKAGNFLEVAKEMCQKRWPGQAMQDKYSLAQERKRWETMMKKKLKEGSAEKKVKKEVRERKGRPRKVRPRKADKKDEGDETSQKRQKTDNVAQEVNRQPLLDDAAVERAFYDFRSPVPDEILVRMGQILQSTKNLSVAPSKEMLEMTREYGVRTSVKQPNEVWLCYWWAQFVENHTVVESSEQEMRSGPSGMDPFIQELDSLIECLTAGLEGA